MPSSSRSRRSTEGAPILRRPLTDADVEMLAGSLINRDLAERALLARVDGPDARDLVGARDQRNYAGIEFPYIDFPGGVGIRGSRIRRDEPEIEIQYGEDGREVRKERNKYVAAVGSRNALYFFPETPLELVGDISVPVLFVEGEKKTLCAWRLATYNVSRPRYLPVGLSGVWGWRGKVGTTETPSGRRRSISGPIPDLSRIPVTGREMLVAFDSDANTNPQVQIARCALAQELRRRGARHVRYVLIPSRREI